MSSTALHVIQFEQLEPGYERMCSDPPEGAKISSEDEVLPTRTMNYAVHNNH